MTPAAIPRPEEDASRAPLLLLMFCGLLSTIVVLGMMKMPSPCVCAECPSDVRLVAPSDSPARDYEREGVQRYDSDLSDGGTVTIPAGSYIAGMTCGQKWHCSVDVVTPAPMGVE
jgi:hypothetical protein